jgi:ubiquinone/menaquinone biosynthesis C-methylase UbiE
VKSFFIAGLVSLVIRFPGFMESGFFPAIMRFFSAAIAHKYDRIIAGQLHYSTPLRAGLLALHELYETDGTLPENVLDLCTGTGIAVLEARKAFPEASLYAVDQSETMIMLARRKAEEAGESNAVFLTADASELPFSNESFDAIVISNAPVFFSEIKRVLRPRGRALVVLSFAGESINRRSKDVERMVSNYGFVTEKIASAGNGVYVILCPLVPA